MIKQNLLFTILIAGFFFISFASLAAAATSLSESEKAQLTEGSESAAKYIESARKIIDEIRSNKEEDLKKALDIVYNTLDAAHNNVEEIRAGNASDIVEQGGATAPKP